MSRGLGRRIERHKLERDAATMQLAHGHICASCMMLLHPTSTCAIRCSCLVPLTYSNLRWWCSYIPTTSTLLALMVVTPLQRALHDGLFLEALVHCMQYCNLHCVVVVVVVMVEWCMMHGTLCHGGVVCMRWQCVVLYSITGAQHLCMIIYHNLH